MSSAKKRSMTEQSAAGIKDTTRARLRLMCCGIIPISTATAFLRRKPAAQIEYTRKKAENGTAGGDSSNLAGGDWSNLAGGDWSNLAGGNSSLIVGRNKCKAKGGLHSVIVLTEWEYDADGNYVPVAVKADVVDGVRIKADTWYTLKDGEFVEADT